MTRYRSRPTEIEAARFVGVSSVPEGQFLEFDVQTIWLQAAIEAGAQVRDKGQPTPGAVFLWGGSLAVCRSNGETQLLAPGDYVARNAIGQIFGCKADLFAQLYEAAS